MFELEWNCLRDYQIFFDLLPTYTIRTQDSHSYFEASITGAMQKTLDSSQRESVPKLLLGRLKQKGKTIDDLAGTRHPGDETQLPYRASPVWYKKGELDDWIAQQLKLPPSLWGPNRVSNDLMILTSRELEKLRRRKVIADWSTKRRTTILRLADPRASVTMPKMSMVDEGRKTDQSTYTEQDMRSVFLSIISRSRKDNTYKFALGKILLDYAQKNPPTRHTHEISYDYLAGEFLKHYWHQKYKFKMKQDFHTKKTPVVIKILEEVFGENPPQFKNLKCEDLQRARQLILENVFGPARKKKGMVIQRFQRTTSGNTTQDNDIFYEYDDERETIFLKPGAHEFFRQNYGLLMRALLAEWVRYLERVNHGLPMLAAKIYNEEAKRQSLAGYRDILVEYSDHCFYCNGHLELACTHVDHFFPWSYIFENEAWNLVLACQTCNIQKSNSVPPEVQVPILIERDREYSKTMKMMKESLRRLSFKGRWDDQIRNHYRICAEYDF